MGDRAKCKLCDGEVILLCETYPRGQILTVGIFQAIDVKCTSHCVGQKQGTMVDS